MTKAAIIQSFWASFGIPAYEEYAVPTGDDAPSFPYITYSLVTDSFDNDVSMYANLWYRGTSWRNANAKAEEISARIGGSGTIIAFENVAVWIRRGTPFAQNMRDDSDDMIKRKYINVTVEYITND